MATQTDDATDDPEPRDLDTTVTRDGFRIEDTETGITVELPRDLLDDHTDEDLHRLIHGRGMARTEAVAYWVTQEALECYYALCTDREGDPWGLPR